MADIFISYASEDLDRVRPLVSALEERGWTVWWDRELVAGPSFDEKIEEALDAARCVVVVWSNVSVTSRWVRTEANEGLERNILVPLLIDDVRPPLAFRIAQTPKLLGWPAQSDQLGMVVDGIAELLGKPIGTSIEPIVPVPLQGTKDSKAIAVLPFTDLSPETNQQYFCDGVAEELLNGLSRLDQLRVVPRTNSFTYKGRDAEAIGRELNVTHILDGSIRKAGDRLRITAQLISVAEGRHIWSENYDGDLSDIFELQETVAAAVVDQLQIELGSTAIEDGLIGLGTKNPQAYNEYLLALHAYNRVGASNAASAEANDRVIRHLKRTLELDDGFVDAHLRLAEAYGALRGVSPSERRELGRPHIEKAKALDPERKANDTWWGMVDLIENPDDQSMERALRERIKNPPYPGDHHLASDLELYARLLKKVELFRTASLYGERAQALQPENPFFASNLAQTHISMGEYDLAVDLLETAMELEPYQTIFRGNWLNALIKGGRLEEAASYLHRKQREPGNYLEILLLLGQGESEQARAEAEHLLASDANIWQKASILFDLGEVDRAFDLLEQAYEREELVANYIRQMVQELLSTDMRDQVRRHPRYHDLLDKMGLGDDWQAEMKKRAATLTPFTGIEIED